IPDALQRGAGAARVERTAVVVAELHEDEVAGLHLGEDLVPQPLGLVRPAAAAAAGPVLDADLRAIKEGADAISPRPQPARALAAAVVHRRLADEEQGRQPRGGGRRLGLVGARGAVQGEDRREGGHRMTHGTSRAHPGGWTSVVGPTDTVVI